MKSPETKIMWSPEVFENVFYEVDEALLLIDTDFVVHRANRASEAIFNSERNELNGKSLGAMVEGNTLEPLALSLKSASSFTFKILREGSIFNIDSVWSKISNQELWKVKLLPKTISNQDDRSQSTNNLMRNAPLADNDHFGEMKYKAILQALPDPLFLADRSGCILEVHVPDFTKLKFTKTELIGKNIREILSEDVVERLFKCFDRLEKGSKLEVMESIVDYPHGSICFETRIVMIAEGNFLYLARDITKAKEREHILLEQKRSLKLALHAGRLGSWEWDLTTNRVRRENFEKILDSTGLSIDESSIEEFYEHIHPADFNILKKKISTALAGQDNFDYEFRIIKNNNNYVWLKGQANVQRDNTGKAYRIVGLTSDNTVFKKEQLYNELSREVLHMIIERRDLGAIAGKIVASVENYIPRCMAAISLINPQNNTLQLLSSFNLPPVFVELFSKGMPIAKNAATPGRSAFYKKEILVEDIAQAPEEKYAALAVANNMRAARSFPIVSSKNELLGVFSFYSQTPRKSTDVDKKFIGDLLQLAMISIEQMTIYDALETNRRSLKKQTEILEFEVEKRTEELTQTVQKLVEANLDLEDQVQTTKAAERRAENSKKLLSSAARSFPKGGIAILNQDLEIIFIDGEELEILGLNKFEVQGKNIAGLVRLDAVQKASFQKNVKRTLNGEHLYSEIDLGDTVYAVNSTPLLEDGKIVQALLVYNNITELKQAEGRILIALKKEQELGEMKSRFISMASHEFRTPLSTIMNSTSLIEKQNGTGQEQQRLKALSKIRSNVKDLVGILSDFLSLSKLQEDKLAALPEPVELVAYTQTIIEELEGNCKPGQTIQLDCDRPRIHIKQDKKLLKHVLLNLLSNAIKYSEENDTITTHIKVVESRFIIEVVDQGIGIPSSEQDNLFDRFFRAENSLNIQGTGLGLHIVKQYVQLMGGKISFKSELNEGSIFSIEIPQNLNDK